MLAITRKMGEFSAAALTVLASAGVVAERFVVGTAIPSAERLELPPIYDALRDLPPGRVVSWPDYRLRPEWFLPFRLHARVSDDYLFGVD